MLIIKENDMARKHKCRMIYFNPEVKHFKPAGIMGKELDYVELTLDELKAIRLADLEGLYQEEAAKIMNISRQTFGNILVSAHQKVADFLINSKSLIIRGGVIEMKNSDNRSFVCYDCKHTFDVPFGTGRPGKCPNCGSNNIHRSGSEKGTRKRRQSANPNCINNIHTRV